MADQEQIINVRIMKGVDLNFDARLSDPGTWQATNNMFAFRRGVLQLRPGSKLVTAAVNQMPSNPVFNFGPNTVQLGLPTLAAQGAKAQIATSTRGIASDANVSYDAATNTKLQQFVVPEESVIPAPLSALASVNSQWPGAGQNAVVGQAIIPSTAQHQVWKVSAITTGVTGGSQPAWTANPTAGVTTVTDGGVTWQYHGGNNAGTMRPDALCRVFYPSNSQALWVGAMSNHTQDYLFYLDPTTNNIQPIPTKDQLALSSPNYASGISSKDGFWQIQVFQSLASYWLNSLSDTNFFVLCVNQVNPPLLVVNAKTSTNTPTGGSNLIAETISCTATGMSGYIMTGPTSFALYGNQVVWGGAKMIRTTFTGDGKDVIRYDNFLMFSDPANTKSDGSTTAVTSLSSDSSVGVYTLQIGDTTEEYVTAVAGSPTNTSFGAQGQLIAFTGKKCMIYNGPLPSSGNPLPPGFALSGVGEVGTWSAKSVIRTSHGTVFLGTDGVVYLISLYNQVVPIGRALEPLLAGNSRLFYSRVCAYYYRGFYHLFFPASANSNVNQLEYVADLRYISQNDPHDAGVLWYGPFTGRYVNCVAVGNAPNDQAPIYAGLAHKAGIIQLEAPGVYSDPSMDNLSKTVYPQWGAITNPLDLGDAHLDKIINAFSLGIGVANATSVSATVAALSDVAGVGAGYSGTKTVNPPANTLNNNFLMGTSVFSDAANFNLPTWQPNNKIRGRAFTLGFTGTPTTDSFVRLSDLEFRVVPVTRRPTDSGTSSV